MGDKMKLSEIADRIYAHLKRFEADPKINARCPTYNVVPYYCAQAHSAGRYVGVRYVCYQGTSHLKRDEAMSYLAALDAGFVGTHYQLERPASKGGSNE